MTVHELIEQLSELPNQEAEVKLLIGNDLYSILGMWTNSRPVIIEGGRKNDEPRCTSMEKLESCTEYA